MKYYDPILFICLHNMNMINTEKLDLNIVSPPILDIRDQHWCFYISIESNISAISWRPALVMEETGVLRENHRPWSSNWYTLSLADASRVHPFCNLQSRARIHAVLVIGFHELLGNPTTES